MPLLEVTQTRHVSASIRLTDSTAIQIDQYASFIRASADEVVEQAVAYVFSKDRDFQEFLKSPEAQRITPTLRVRRGNANDAAEPLLRGDKMTPEQFKEMLRYVKTNKRRAAADMLASYAEGATEQP